MWRLGGVVLRTVYLSCIYNVSCRVHVRVYMCGVLCVVLCVLSIHRSFCRFVHPATPQNGAEPLCAPYPHTHTRVYTHTSSHTFLCAYLHGSFKMPEGERGRGREGLLCRCTCLSVCLSTCQYVAAFSCLRAAIHPSIRWADSHEGGGCGRECGRSWSCGDEKGSSVASFSSVAPQPHQSTDLTFLPQPPATALPIFVFLVLLMSDAYVPQRLLGR